MGVLVRASLPGSVAFFSAVLLLTIGNTCATAQNAPPGESEGSNTAASGGLAEILVTAQRREQNLQQVPIAVSALSADELANANVTSALDLGNVVSGMVIQQTTGTVTTFIRGLGNNQLTVGNEASNSLYIDGVYMSRMSPVMLRLENVDRVEVLKGPQGTLFGRNAEGGLINIITSTPRPGQEGELSVSAGYGNYQTFDSSLNGAMSIGSNSAVSISAVYSNQNQGWGTNTLTGAETNTETDVLARMKFVSQLADTTKLTIEADVNDSDSSIGLLNYFVGLNPAPAGYGDGSGLLPLPTSRYDKNSNLEDLANTHGYGGYARLEQNLSFANFVGTVALHNERIAYHNDIDKSSLTYFHFEEDDVRDNTWSAEAQLFSKQDKGFSWTGGLFFLSQDYGFPVPAKIYGDSFGPGVTVLVGDKGSTNSYAGYGQVNFDLAQSLRATLGGRYNDDKIIGHGLTDLDVAGTFIPGAPLRADASYGKFTWRAGLDWTLMPDVMTYASISTGTKAGVFNFVTFNPTPVKPENLTAYEVGLKSELLDRRLRLNAAVFYYDYTDLQVQTQQPNGVTNLSNAKGAHIKGAELETQWAPAGGLSLRANITYLNAKYTDYPNAPFYQPNPDPPYGLFPSTVASANGNWLSRAPEISATAGGDYTVAIQSGELALGLNYAYSDHFYWNPDNLVRQASYGILNANIGYTFPGHALKVELWGSNLTDAVYNLTENEFGGPVGTSSGPGAPRTYGVRFRYKLK